MANTIYWGQAAVENTNGFGKSATNNTIDFGEICADSWSPETNLTGTGATPSFSNTKSTEYDGMDAYVDCGSTSYLQNLTEFSISIWAKQPTATSTQCLIGDWNFNTQGNIALETGTASSGATKLTFYIRELNGTIRITTTQNFVFTENVWNHIVVTFNSGTLDIYVNGIAQGLSVPILPSSLAHNDGTLDIGYFEGLGRNFFGNIDEVSIFNSELSASDVTAIYGTGVPNDISSLSPLSWWRFEETSGLTAIDSGTGGNDGVLDNTVVRSTDVPT